MAKCKFIVTGPMRSGTTYLSSILNGQKEVGCFEAYPWDLFKKAYKFREELECELAIRESEFIHLGLKLPEFGSAETTSDLIKLYNQHLVDQFNISMLGFKRTMLSELAINERIKDGTKVIILRRETQHILKSWVRRIEPNLDLAAHKLHRYYQSINFYENFNQNPDVMVVNFNRLASEKEKVCKELAEFLGIPIDSDATRYYSFNRTRMPFENNTSYNYSTVKTKLFADLNNKYSAYDFASFAKNIDNNTYFSTRYRWVEMLKKFYYSKFMNNS